MHIADHDSKEVYVPGAAPDDKEQPSFPVRAGAIRPLSSDGLLVQTSPDSDVPWAEDIIFAMDSHDQPQVLDPPHPFPESALDEEDYLEVRGLYLYRIHVKPRMTRYSPFELSEMPPWNLENIHVFSNTEPKDGVRDESYWTNHAEGLSVLMYDAQGVRVPWTGTTRFELVLPPNIFKENGRNYMGATRAENSVPENHTTSRLCT